MKTSKTSKGVVFFDLETTGTDIAKDRIVQIAIVRKNIDGSVEEKCTLINPEIPIPKEATEVHKITNEMVQDPKVPKFSQVAKSLYSYIEGYDMAGFNILKFDIPLLVEEFLRSGIPVDFSGIKYFDVMVLFQKLNPRDLSACFKHYLKKDLEGGHDALVDTKATSDVFDEMIKVEPELKDLSSDEISKMSMHNEEIIDFSGKFVRNEAGIICYNFGKDKGNPVSKNLSFLDWMIGKDFTEDTKNWCRKLKKGEVV